MIFFVAIFFRTNKSSEIKEWNLKWKKKLFWCTWLTLPLSVLELDYRDSPLLLLRLTMNITSIVIPKRQGMFNSLNQLNYFGRLIMPVYSLHTELLSQILQSGNTWDLNSRITSIECTILYPWGKDVPFNVNVRVKKLLMVIFITLRKFLPVDCWQKPYLLYANTFLILLV